ncbi:histidine phosphatase family protein [Ciceribacter sp. L1K23]|uniref:histidine phosphatase family protein n=1 Tax=Ciceribacter sp. L1K23 TaxID=2820276 RepID=UPI001B83A31D|nr:histidine phosphatase family protein [Ciceribacter sp. L1K23]
MLIYMIRHGQTDWNAEGRFQGQHDIPLNDTGRGQATGNGEMLASLIGDAAADYDFVASPLSRTRETMELLRSAMGLRPLAYRTDGRLKEISFGDWEGHTFHELALEFPDKIAARAAGKWDFIPPGTDAESYEILSWRVGAWLGEVSQPTICVAHGGVMRTVMKLVDGRPADDACEMNIPQDRILKIDRDDGITSWL